MSTRTDSHPASAGSAGIDPRGPRFAAAVTAVTLLVAIVLGLTVGGAPAIALLAAIAIVFAIGAFAGVRRNPYGAFFRAVIRPRLAPPTEFEDPRPPTFAQLVGFIVTAVGTVLALVGVPYAVPIAAAIAFIAAFLNAVFGLCIGCQLYLLLVRVRWIRQTA